MFYTIKDQKVILQLKAQPGASRSEFAGIYGENAVKIRIKAAAVEGAANKELKKFISKNFKVPKSDILFKSGEQSKSKVITFPLTEAFLSWLEESGYVLDSH